MLRQMLTMLAILSGFAAVAEPARAAHAAAAVETIGRAEQQPASLAVRAFVHLVPKPRLVGQSACPLQASTAIVPTIRLRVDRARE